jgi:hypothetical protein
MQVGVHTSEPLAPEPNSLDYEIGIEKLKSYKSPGILQIPAELIQGGGKTSCSEIHIHINSA